MMIDELIVKECGARGHGIGCERMQTNVLREAVAQPHHTLAYEHPCLALIFKVGESCCRAPLDLQYVQLHVLEFDLSRPLVDQ